MKVNTRRIKAERVAMGLTQEEMAKSINMTRSAYAKRENGIVSFGADDIANVASILGYSDRMQIFFCSDRSRKATKLEPTK